MIKLLFVAVISFLGLSSHTHAAGTDELCGVSVPAANINYRKTNESKEVLNDYAIRKARISKCNIGKVGVIVATFDNSSAEAIMFY